MVIHNQIFDDKSNRLRQIYEAKRLLEKNGYKIIEKDVNTKEAEKLEKEIKERNDEREKKLDEISKELKK